MMGVFNPPAVTLGPDPRMLLLPCEVELKSPRVKPEGDDQGWGEAGDQRWTPTPPRKGGGEPTIARPGDTQ